jgi:hypothetical protein
VNEEVENESAPRGALATMKAHPFITGTMLTGILVGAACGFFLLPEEWITARRIAAGAFAGGGIGLTLTATKMIG